MGFKAILKRELSLLLLSYGFLWVYGQEFSMSGGGCHSGHSGPDCPRTWSITGGPGWVGQRPGYPVETICSPSCTDVNSPKVCSLILAMHGIYSNPNDQKWLMIGTGSDANAETFLEDEDHGGPFCISFHKSKDDAWEYKCGGDDEAHLEAFIHFALENFPIDPNAVNIHGFSSGGIQIHHMMSTSCSIEKLISAASTYGSGNVDAPPTTKAAYLIAHGTHDRVVVYDNKWDFNRGKAYPSCDCDKPPGGGGCFDASYLHLQGERLAGAIAQLRGYTGDIWGSGPTPSYKLDLINDDLDRCNTRMNECGNPIDNPNPFNDGFDCADVAFSGSLETDVLKYPVPDSAAAVEVWRMNIHNHDYPDVRRNNYYSATEFFFQLKNFFNNNRGRQSYPGTRSITQQSSGSVCSNPSWDAVSPEYINKKQLYYDLSPDECRDTCLNEYRCVDAFYIDLRPWNSVQNCVIYYDTLPCLSTSGAHWFNPQHWKGSTVATPTYSPSSGPVSPTIPPNSQPIPAPTPNSQPIPAPTPAPTPSLCIAPDVLVPGAIAGYSCLVNGISNGQDSNAGDTEASCMASNSNAEWVTYDCATAESYWLTQDEGTQNYFRDEWWGEICCDTSTPTPSPTLCLPPDVLNSEALAGYSCLVNGVSNGQDSNAGDTEASCLASDPNAEWTPYDCATAEAYWLTQDEGMQEFFRDEWWGEVCCGASSPTGNPTASPVNQPTPTIAPDCPAECSVPSCIWLGTDGPGWDPSWTRDEDGTPTSNGFCTTYCQEYDPEGSPGKHLCGDGEWHQSGVDCTACGPLALNPLLDPQDRQPSSGLCASVENMSGHFLWGTGIKQCLNGPQPSDDNVCTVHQSFNGDATVNPERTCESFCTHFELSCINGYDDGEDGCVYGGDGIGCDNILGEGSVGGPTPDHVCVCGPAVEETSAPISAAPIPAPTDAPIAPTDSPVSPPTDAPVAPTDAPVSPTNAPVAPTSAPVAPTDSPVTPPTDAPVAPTNAPVSPTSSPVSPPTDAPVAPTEAPITPTNAPVAPTDSPVALPTDAPVPPTSSPVSPPTNAPVAPTEAPVTPTNAPVAPTDSPVALPTDAPVSPTSSPVTPPTDAPVAPTEAPVTPTNAPVAPTDSPVALPTDAPVSPTSSPVSPPTDAPVAPTEAPITPTNAPVAPTDSPVAPPTDAPVSPTSSPVSPPTNAPVAPTEAPVTPTNAPVAPTDAPVSPPTDAPVTPTNAPVAPTDAPVAPPTDAPIAPTEAPIDEPAEWITILEEGFESGWNEFIGKKKARIVKSVKHSGSQSARLIHGKTSSKITSVDIDVQAYSDLRLTFWFQGRGMEAGEYFILEYKYQGNWMPLDTWISGGETGFRNKVWIEDTLSVPTSGNILKLRFKNAGGDNSDKIFIDDILLSGIYKPGQAPTMSPTTTPLPPTNAPTATPPNEGFNTRDIGTLELEGSTEFVNENKISMQASGSDIWGRSDNFRFTYQQYSGNNFGISALVHKPTVNNEWTKAGIMLRAGLGADAKNIGMFYTGNHGILCQGRQGVGSDSLYYNADWINRNTPIWLAIVRDGNNLSFYKSDDASNWSILAYTNFDLGADLYVGVALVSHVESRLTTGTFEHFTITEF